MYNYSITLTNKDNGLAFYSIYFTNKKLYSEVEFTEIVAKCIKEIAKEYDAHRTRIGNMVYDIDDKISKYGFESLKFEGQLDIPNVTFGTLKNSYKTPNIKKFCEIIDYTEQDINEEFDDKLQELKGCIDKVAWYAHARDHNKALKALDRIIYAVSRDLDE